MKLSDWLRRWWAPAKWRDEHPEASDGEGFALSAEQRRTDTVGKGKQLPKEPEPVDLGPGLGQ
jgi:hypothetical protein